MGETVLFSEQDIRFAESTAEWTDVIDKSIIPYQGSIEELGADEEIKKKLLDDINFALYLEFADHFVQLIG